MKGFSKDQIRKLALICGGVALLVVLVTVLIVVLTRSGGDEPENPAESGPVIPEGMRLVHDIHNGDIIVPDFDIPENEYSHDGFTKKEDGFIHYEGAVAGIDVSQFQGEVDWYAVKAAGIDFAIIRLGYRGMTQGLLAEDTHFRQNLEGAYSADIQRGVYFFSQAVTVSEAEAEADFVLEHLDGAELQYPVVFDWEHPIESEDMPKDTLRAWDCPGDVVTDCAEAFCKKIKAAGYTPCVYFNKHQAYNFYDLEQLKDYGFWYAEYESLPSVCYGFRMWQYSESGTVPGIDVAVDLDLCFEPYGK